MGPGIAAAIAIVLLLVLIMQFANNAKTNNGSDVDKSKVRATRCPQAILSIKQALVYMPSIMRNVHALVTPLQGITLVPRNGIIMMY